LMLVAHGAATVASDGRAGSGRSRGSGLVLYGVEHPELIVSSEPVVGSTEDKLPAVRKPARVCDSGVGEGIAAEPEAAVRRQVGDVDVAVEPPVD
jgi:hypothetical protein